MNNTLTQLDTTQLQKIIASALKGADDGEIFLEHRPTESISLSGGATNASASISAGFGVRRVVGDQQGYVYGAGFDPANMRKAARQLRQAFPAAGTLDVGPKGPQGTAFYTPLVTLGSNITAAGRARLLQQIEAYARTLDPNVAQVSATLGGEIQNVLIVRPDGLVVRDTRPMVRLTVQVQMQSGNSREEGHASVGGRYGYAHLFDPATWQPMVQKAIADAKALLTAGPCPAGEMPVILGNGWAGVLLHEAIGHGLEADAVRKGSAFTGRMGQTVAAKGVTVVDDGTIADCRGSLNVDDEGTATEKTVLIEDGKLVKLMSDRLEARLAGTASTGNCRRQSYRHVPMVRMRSTYAEGGNDTLANMIANTKYGLFAQDFGGGQVDTTRGSFQFTVSRGVLIENGKPTRTVKGASLIGNCVAALLGVDMIGNDMALAAGGGTCGKAGQSVPVNVGQPSLRIATGITVGGSDA